MQAALEAARIMRTRALDHDLLDRLSDDVPKWHHMFKPPFEIKRFENCWQTGRRIYTLKPYDEDGHLSTT